MINFYQEVYEFLVDMIYFVWVLNKYVNIYNFYELLIYMQI